MSARERCARRATVARERADDRTYASGTDAAEHGVMQTPEIVFSLVSFALAVAYAVASIS